MTGPTLRRPQDALAHFTAALFAAAGLDAGKAEAMGRILVLTDMMGRHTHGLAQVPAYLDQVERGLMEGAGEPETLRDTGGTIVWDGGYRPGAWLVERALHLGFERLPRHGTVTFAIRKSHHIGCLAALAKAATDRGYLAILASSGPHTKIVAPFGGTTPLFSPNPFAIGYPATEFPVLVDISASITTVSMTREKAVAGQQFEHPWLLDHEGRPTRDPSVAERAEKRGSLMLLGGMESGHKGFGLALMVEALTGGLAGHGRREAPTRWGANVFLQLLDPEAFAGREAFVAQMDFFAEQVHANPPTDPAAPVRLPGEKAARLIAQAEAEGVPVPAALAETLRGHAARLGVDASLL
jgi:LDH2 family malate/lactate/ureidoglycolate dehydrogenase